MTNEEAVNVLRIMASGIELKGYSDHWILNFREAYEMAIKALEPVKQCKFCKHCGDADYCSDCHSDHSLFEE